MILQSNNKLYVSEEIGKVRDCKYDNLKFILIFLVVFGHLIEITGITSIYKIIYMFHMPMFIFISGYFTKDTRKSIINTAFIYIVWQTIYFFIYKYLLSCNISLNYFYPIWILWYMFALIIWKLIVYFIPFKDIENKKSCMCIIVITFGISLICGFIDNIGYYFSLSRIVTFFPYFLIGYLSKNNKFNPFDLNKEAKLYRYKLMGYLIIAVISVTYFLHIIPINYKPFYGSYSYNVGNYDMFFKLIWIFFSLSIMFLLYNVVPNKRINIITKIGSNTLIIYLMHGVIINILKIYGKSLFIYDEFLNLGIMFIITLLLLLLLGNDFMKKSIKYLINIDNILLVRLERMKKIKSKREKHYK